jgi:hypothetical protein
MFVESTFSAILSEIAKIPLEKATIHLSQKVVAVKTKDGDEGSKVMLRTEKGEMFKFDEVVMTTPLGWLKRNKGVFEPALPDRLLSAIDSISVGRLEKVRSLPTLPIFSSPPPLLQASITHKNQVYITFPTAFWLSSSDTKNDNFPGYTNWLSPSYAPTTNPSKWAIEAWTRASFTPPNNHPTLIFYLYGPLSTYLTSLLPSPNSTSTTTAVQIQQAQKELEEFFNPYISLLPNYSSSLEECKPKKILCTNWQNDELAGNGSYCNFQVGIKDAATDVDVLRNGVKERGLWIAGEAAAPYEECESKFCYLLFVVCGVSNWEMGGWVCLFVLGGGRNEILFLGRY